MLVERNNGQENKQFQLWGTWLHPSFTSYDQIEWQWAEKIEEDGLLKLPWAGYPRPLIVVEKKQIFSDSGCSERMLARVDSGIAWGTVANEIVLPQITKWRWEKNDGDWLCWQMRGGCIRGGLSETGVIIVCVGIYFPRKGWVKVSPHI